MGRINYSKTINQALSIKDLSNSLENQIERLENLYQKIGGEWCGPAADAYRKQLSKLIADMKATNYDMEKLVSKIREVARNITEEDEKLIAFTAGDGRGGGGGGGGGR